MSILPAFATFYSFFIVLAVLSLGTIFSVAYIPRFLHTILSPLHLLLAELTQRLSRTAFTSYLRSTLDILNSEAELSFSNAYDPGWLRHPGIYHIFRTFRWFLRRLPAYIVHGALVCEIGFPRDQWVMYQYRGNDHLLHIGWHPLAFVRDVVRFALLPAWVAIAVGLVVYIVCVDTVCWFLITALEVLIEAVIVLPRVLCCF
ncbi:hypothetical protein BU23DRAFT_288759 [Bimuria novae-zelandiae CBS 107.79]|uniref:Uncharacterized protein n=1 Tax=Bimuria novae-zelandiae CBS 107.79 TaxID=1447943 RepID=A0A6A5V2W4_9PLEO|nr:hypothetical protein BU23DRAFT_288759 [Bimuria novae-zelandiae CBS 107.79]